MTIPTAASLLLIAAALAGCEMTSADLDGRDMTPGERAAAFAAVDPARDCYNKPWYDTVSASDRHTVIKGMTPIERQVCGERMRTDTNQR